MPLNDDTLDIQPLLPIGATPWTPDFDLGDGVLNPGGDKNPEAAAQARAKISMVHAPGSKSVDIPEVPFKTARPAATPVSPAHQEVEASQPAIKRHLKRVSKVRPILNALGSFLLLVLIFKAPVFYNQLKFQFSNPGQQQSNNQVGAVDAPVAVSGDPMFIIPKINIKAPLVFEESIEEAKVNKALERGVVHYGISAKPGEVGNTVITGHSSNDWWQPGDYKYIFVLLGKLVPGDHVFVNYQGTQYKYEVTEKKIVEPTDVSVVAPTGEPTLTLITCWPAGTNLKREIIRAKQVSPQNTPGTPLKIAKTPQTGVLPGNSRSLTQQIGDFWKSVTGAFSQKPTEVKTN